MNSCIQIRVYTRRPGTDYSVTLNIWGRLCSTVSESWLTLSVPFFSPVVYQLIQHPHPRSPPPTGEHYPLRHTGKHTPLICMSPAKTSNRNQYPQGVDIITINMWMRSHWKRPVNFQKWWVIYCNINSLLVTLNNIIKIINSFRVGVWQAATSLAQAKDMIYHFPQGRNVSFNNQYKCLHNPSIHPSINYLYRLSFEGQRVSWTADSGQEAGYTLDMLPAYHRSTYRDKPITNAM